MTFAGSDGDAFQLSCAPHTIQLRIAVRSPDVGCAWLEGGIRQDDRSISMLPARPEICAYVCSGRLADSPFGAWHGPQ